MNKFQFPPGFSATANREFTFKYLIPRSSYYSFNEPSRDKRLIQLWSYLALYTKIVHWQSSTISTRPYLHNHDDALSARYFWGFWKWQSYIYTESTINLSWVSQWLHDHRVGWKIDYFQLYQISLKTIPCCYVCFSTYCCLCHSFISTVQDNIYLNSPPSLTTLRSSVNLSTITNFFTCLMLLFFTFHSKIKYPNDFSKDLVTQLKVAFLEYIFHCLFRQKDRQRERERKRER